MAACGTDEPAYEDPFDAPDDIPLERMLGERPVGAFLGSDFCAAYHCRLEEDWVIDDGWIWAIRVDADPDVTIELLTRGDGLESADLAFYERERLASGASRPEPGDRELATAFITGLTGSTCGILNPFSGPVIRSSDAQTRDLPASTCGDWAVQNGHTAGAAVVRVLPEAVNQAELPTRGPIR